MESPLPRNTLPHLMYRANGTYRCASEHKLMCLVSAVFLLMVATYYLSAQAHCRYADVDHFDSRVLPSEAPLFGNLTTYYINLDKYKGRREQMERILRSDTAQRIEAVNGDDIAALEKLFEPDDEDRWRKGPAQYLYSRHHCVPGQLGNYLSHLKAMSKAYEHGDDYVIILEDDVNDRTRRLWPIQDLQPILEQADAFHPGWNAIRLQWHDYRHKVEDLENSWWRKVSKYAKSLPPNQKKVLDEMWGFWKFPDGGVPLVMPYSGGWGNMATLWSRRGLEFYLEKYKSTSSGKFLCPAEGACVADLAFWTESGVLVTTPPLIGPRITSRSTEEIRRNVQSDHSKTHLSSLKIQLAWLMRTAEIFDNT